MGFFSYFSRLILFLAGRKPSQPPGSASEFEDRANGNCSSPEQHLQCSPPSSSNSGSSNSSLCKNEPHLISNNNKESRNGDGRPPLAHNRPVTHHHHYSVPVNSGSVLDGQNYLPRTRNYVSNGLFHYAQPPLSGGQNNQQFNRVPLPPPVPNGGNGVCPGCRMPYDKARKRRLIDECGHERCLACICNTHVCPICQIEGEVAFFEAFLFFFFSS